MTEKRSTSPPAKDADLSWLFRQAASDMGYSACDPGGVSVRTSNGYEGSVTDRRYSLGPWRRGSAARMRDLEGLLALLDPQHQVVLRLAYGPDCPDATYQLSPQMHADFSKAFGAWYTVATVSARAASLDGPFSAAHAERGQIRGRLERLRKRTTGDAGKDARDEIKTEAARLMAAAYAAWVEVRGERRRRTSRRRFGANEEVHSDDNAMRLAAWA